MCTGNTHVWSNTYSNWQLFEILGYSKQLSFPLVNLPLGKPSVIRTPGYSISLETSNKWESFRARYETRVRIHTNFEAI